MSDIIKFQRGSLATLIKEVEQHGPTAMGVVALIYDNDGHGQFRISGFAGSHGTFLICGLLDWIKADLMNDVANHTEPLYDK